MDSACFCAGGALSIVCIVGEPGRPDLGLAAAGGGCGRADRERREGMMKG